jgi:hypothetical protein
MNGNPSFSFGRFIVFAGVGMAFLTMFSYTFRALDRALSEGVLLSVIFAVLAASVLGVLYLYRKCPERMVIPIGIAGWILTFVLVFLRNWY